MNLESWIRKGTKLDYWRTRSAIICSDRRSPERAEYRSGQGIALAWITRCQEALKGRSIPVWLFPSTDEAFGSKSSVISKLRLSNYRQVTSLVPNISLIVRNIILVKEFNEFIFKGFLFMMLALVLNILHNSIHFFRVHGKGSIAILPIKIQVFRSFSFDPFRWPLLD